MTTSGSGGDQVAKGRASNGDLLSTEIFTWSGGYLSVQNPGSSSASPDGGFVEWQRVEQLQHWNRGGGLFHFFWCRVGAVSNHLD